MMKCLAKDYSIVLRSSQFDHIIIMNPFSKRQRAEGLGGVKRKYSSMGSSSNKGRMAGIRFSKLKPWGSYGATRIKRGSAFSLKNFGRSFSAANARQKSNRRQFGFSGRGMYGQQVANGIVGEAAGLWDRFTRKGAGQLLNAGMEAIYGRGSYVGNELMKGGGMGLPEKFTTVPNDTRDLILSRSEYLQDIVVPASSAFTVPVQIAINPGLSASFPWGSQISSNFDEYELIQLVYEFRSMIPEGSSNAQGTIVMAAVYDVTDPVFTSKQTMENYEASRSCKITESMLFGVECDPTKRSGPAAEYIRTGALPANQDVKTYDLANFYLAVQGTGSLAANTTLGELYVHYKVRLSKARVNTQAASLISANVANANTIGLSTSLTAGIGNLIPTANVSFVSVSPVISKTYMGSFGSNFGGWLVFDPNLPYENFYKVTFVIPYGTAAGGVTPVVSAYTNPSKFNNTNNSSANGGSCQGGYIVPITNGGDMSLTSSSMAFTVNKGQRYSTATTGASVSYLSVTFLLRATTTAGSGSQLALNLGLISAYMTSTTGITNIGGNVTGEYTFCGIDRVDPSGVVSTRTVAITAGPAPYLDPTYFWSGSA